VGVHFRQEFKGVGFRKGSILGGITLVCGIDD